MSRVYDNWERLADAVLKKQHLREIALCPSFSSLSSSSSADLSSRLSFDSPLRDASVAHVLDPSNKRGNTNLKHWSDSYIMVRREGLFAWHLEEDVSGIPTFITVATSIRIPKALSFIINLVSRLFEHITLFERWDTMSPAQRPESHIKWEESICIPEPTTNRRRKQLQTVTLKVDMTCEKSERKVKKVLSYLHGVIPDSVVINRNQQKVSVRGYIEESKVLKAVKSTGKKAEIWSYDPYNLVPETYAPQAYEKYMTYTAMFSDDNPDGCSIM